MSKTGNKTADLQIEQLHLGCPSWQLQILNKMLKFYQDHTSSKLLYFPDLRQPQSTKDLSVKRHH